MVRITVFGLLFCLVFCPCASAQSDDLARRAMHGDAQAIQALRAQGPDGLKSLLDVAGDRPNAAIDAVAAQKDAHASRLYWYTDLEQAKAAATREGKPILSLRLLGRLDQDLSCANSRFFRTTLYPDPTVSKLLRENFILHWSSERPVPVVTIDFGDGRVMKRTITGNSIHYVLDAQARPIDALPGLYSADKFVKKLSDALKLHSQLNGPDRDEKLAAWHRAAMDVKEEIKRVPLAPQVRVVVAAKAPPAEKAEKLTASKGRVEMPMIASIRRLEDSIAQDTERNENDLHHQIHGWFAQRQVMSFVAFNNRAYTELFFTPRSDPWLGLAPADVYSGLENAGLASR